MPRARQGAFRRRRERLGARHKDVRDNRLADRISLRIRRFAFPMERHHVAWRGGEMPSDVRALVAQIRDAAARLLPERLKRNVRK